MSRQEDRWLLFLLQMEVSQAVLLPDPGCFFKGGLWGIRTLAISNPCRARQKILQSSHSLPHPHLFLEYNLKKWTKTQTEEGECSQEWPVDLYWKGKDYRPKKISPSWRRKQKTRQLARARLRGRRPRTGDDGGLSQSRGQRLHWVQLG